MDKPRQKRADLDPPQSKNARHGVQYLYHVFSVLHLDGDSVTERFLRKDANLVTY